MALTIQQVVAELRQECKVYKVYQGVMPQSSFAWTLGRIESGKSKMCTIAEFFNLFGYTGSYNEWQKTMVIPSMPKHLRNYAQAG
jgi:hypothetical protein